MPRARSGMAAAAAAILLVAGAAVVAWSARDPGPEVRWVPAQGGVAHPALPYTFEADAYGIHTVPRRQYPYARIEPTDLVDSGVHDASGVRMHRAGGRLHDHPVHQARYGLDNLESHVLTGDERYLDRAELQAARLLRRAEKVDGAWYLPYASDFDLHGVASDRMVAPWYSAMAQGQAVTLFVRLFEITGDRAYRDAADGLFASFLRPREAGGPWTVWVDGRNHLWLEEFPGRDPDRTLNGHLFATFGLWDYWRLTSDARAKTLFQGALTTVVDHFARYRNENWISRYCLTHPHRLSGSYHAIHIRQLVRIFALSHDAVFLRLAETLAADYPAPAVTGTVRFAAGAHRGVRFTADGTVARRRTVRLAAGAGAPADRRSRIQGQPGYWYRITGGPFAGYHVREKHAVVALRGRSAGIDHHPARPATMRAGRSYTGVEFAADGTELGRLAVAPAADTAFDVTASAWWNAREYVLAGTGPLAGRWIHRAELRL